MRRHRQANLASSQFRLCLSEKKPDSCRSLSGCIVQRNEQLSLLRGVVERDDKTFFLRFTNKNVRRFIGCEMPKLSGAQRRMFAAKPQQRLNIGENLLLVSGPTGLRERVV